MTSSNDKLESKSRESLAGYGLVIDRHIALHYALWGKGKEGLRNIFKTEPVIRMRGSEGMDVDVNDGIPTTCLVMKLPELMPHKLQSILIRPEYLEAFEAALTYSDPPHGEEPPDIHVAPVEDDVEALEEHLTLPPFSSIEALYDRVTSTQCTSDEGFILTGQPGIGKHEFVYTSPH